MYPYLDSGRVTLSHSGRLQYLTQLVRPSPSNFELILHRNLIFFFSFKISV